MTIAPSRETFVYPMLDEELDVWVQHIHWKAHFLGGSEPNAAVLSNLPDHHDATHRTVARAVMLNSLEAVGRYEDPRRYQRYMDFRGNRENWAQKRAQRITSNPAHQALFARQFQSRSAAIEASDETLELWQRQAAKYRRVETFVDTALDSQFGGDPVDLSGHGTAKASVQELPLNDRHLAAVPVLRAHQLMRTLPSDYHQAIELSRSGLQLLVLSASRLHDGSYHID